MKSMLLISAMIFSGTVFAIDCPKKINVKVTEIESLSPDNSKKVNEFFELGDKQTDKAYIQAVLTVAKNLRKTEDVLTYSKKQSGFSSTCFYRGKTTSLVVKPKTFDEEDGYTSVLKLGKINYRSENGNPTSHKGNALDLTTHLRQFDKNNIVEAKNRKSILSFDLEVQIPLGDFGTDGYSETAEVGKAWVEYSIAE